MCEWLHYALFIFISCTHLFIYLLSFIYFAHYLPALICVFLILPACFCHVYVYFYVCAFF